MAIRRKKLFQEKFDGYSRTSEVFEALRYEEVTFRRSTLRQCTWVSCDFFRLFIGADTVFEACVFRDCRFTGQHTHLGGPARFSGCQFINCLFKDVSFSDASFEDCKFSGRWISVCLYGPTAPQGWRTVMTNVDLTGVDMDMVEFRRSFDTRTVSLPEVKQVDGYPSWLVRAQS
jgi:uncharacterized protein YjbI with pentapeptide repeats